MEFLGTVVNNINDVASKIFTNDVWENNLMNTCNYVELYDMYEDCEIMVFFGLLC